MKGQTLKEKLARGPLKTDEVLELGIQLADALDAAHSEGIVHRDIKPANLFVTERGQAKILDFGLAKAARKKVESGADTETGTDPDLDLTKAGSTVGTVSYMSPEQALGEKVDARTDLFSLGVVIYEAVTSRQPFTGATSAAVFHQIISQAPTAPVQLNPDAPVELQQVINKALEKDAKLRYQHASDLRTDLSRLKRDTDVNRSATMTVASGALPSSASPSPSDSSSDTRIAIGLVKRHRLTLLGLVAVLLVVAFASYQMMGPGSSTVEDVSAITSIAVLPFENVSGDPDSEYLSDGITETLINKLSKLPNLKVVARGTMFRYKDSDVDPVQIGGELSVDAVLTGRLEQRGDTLVVRAEMVGVESGEQLWGDRFDRTASDLLDLEDDISLAITDNLRPQIAGDDLERITRRYTESTEAHELYLRGRYEWNKRTGTAIQRAIEYFEQSIDADPTYALAFTGLADCYNVLSTYVFVPDTENFPKAKAAATRALQIDETLAEAHASLAFAKFHYDWDWAGAESEFERAIELNPEYPTAHHWYALFLAQLDRRTEAVREIRRAIELDPFSTVIQRSAGIVFMFLRDPDQAIVQGQKALDLDPDAFFGHRLQGYNYELKGNHEEAITEFLEWRRLYGDSPATMESYREAYASDGLMGFRRKRLEQLKDEAEKGYVPSGFIAFHHALLGEKEAAFEFLERAFQERWRFMTELKTSWMWDSLRSDPRFDVFLEQLNFPE